MARQKRVGIEFAEREITKNVIEYARLITVPHPLLRRAIDENLTEKQKAYLLEYYFGQRSEAEIAKKYGVNKSTVSRTVTRARKRLMEVFKYYRLMK